MSTQPAPQEQPASEWVVDQEAGDSVIIAGDIEIVLLAVRGDRAHIGVIVPDGVSVARSEIYRQHARDYLT